MGPQQRDSDSKNSRARAAVPLLDTRKLGVAVVSTLATGGGLAAGAPNAFAGSGNYCVRHVAGPGRGCTPSTSDRDDFYKLSDNWGFGYGSFCLQYWISGGQGFKLYKCTGTENTIFDPTKPYKYKFARCWNNRTVYSESISCWEAAPSSIRDAP